MGDKKDLFLTAYTPVHEPFERFCRARSHGQMPYKDLMQETLLVAFSKFESLREPDKFLYFLFGIATRILSNDRKKKKPVSIEEISTADPITWPDPELRSEIEQLHRALAKLPVDQQEAIVLFEIVGFSVREIATYQQKSEEAVRQHLSRGRQKLVKLLTEQTASKSLFP